MPFIAKNSQTGERIDITKIENPRNTLKASELVCQCCDWPMIIRSGLVARPHFAHKPGRDECPYVAYARAKTPEHLAAQEALRDHLAGWFQEYTSTQAELEVMIRDTTHKKTRFADVMFTFPNGWRVAHEIQLASITTQELDERTQDYLGAGIDVFWWFGRDADTVTNREWSYKTYGHALRISIREATTASDTSFIGQAQIN